MGVWGWDEIKDDVKLQGIATENPRVADDGDWNLLVAPARGFRALLMNAFGNWNQNGLIECEVEPAQHLKTQGHDVGAAPIAEQFMGSPKGKFVTLTGTWSVDRSHSVYGNPLILGDSTWGKTEIHPITSILVEHPPAPDNSSRSVDFLVFSDDEYILLPAGAAYVPNLSRDVPHANTNRTGTFEVPIPLGSSFNMANELDQAQSKNVSIQNTSRFRTVTFQISSGTPQDGKGFYHARIVLPGFTLLTFLLSRGIEPSTGIRETMHRAHVTSLRKLFMQLDAGVLPPIPSSACPGLLDQISALQDDITSVYRQQKALQKSGGQPKPPQDPAFQKLQKEMKDLLDKMNALNAQAEASGCYG